MMNKNDTNKTNKRRVYCAPLLLCAADFGLGFSQGLSVGFSVRVSVRV